MKERIFARILLGGVLGLPLTAPATPDATLPKVWMSAQWRDPYEETVRACAEQGVDVVEVPSWTTNHCAYALAMLRKYKIKGFTSSGQDPSESVPANAVEGKTIERAVFTGGAYRGKAIDRTLFTFEPKAYDIVIEPPVYSARQGYASKKKGPDGKMRTVRSGHYFGAFVPTGEAEIIVPEKLFDGEPHVRIIPCKVLPVEDGRKPEKDTVTDKMSGPEIENRHLVRLVFDLSDCKALLLDKVGIAVYWTSDTESDNWKKRRRGQFSVFSEHTRRAAREGGAWRANQWVLANGGTFPQDDIIAIRFGDECFNLTGWVDCPAASFPLWGFSPSGRAAFAREGRAPARPPSAISPREGRAVARPNREGRAAARPPLIQPRTWGYPEIYGSEAYGIALYSYHKACAELTRAFVEGVRSVAPTLKVFRNTTRGDAWSEGNDHDGSGQELLARELDFIHLDPYPVGGRYNSQVIPFDMGYLSGLARRYHKPLMPWMQAHSYAPNGLGNITPADMKRMWEQHAPFAPDAMMWLGFDMKPGKTDTEMTFPKGAPESWAYAKELFAEVHGVADAQQRVPPVAGRDKRVPPIAKLAVIRPYSTRAICCSQGPVWAAWRNPADRILEAYVRAWSVDNGLLYDIFELPPTGGSQFIAPESGGARSCATALMDELKKYPYIVSTIPLPDDGRAALPRGRVRILGEGTAGTVMTAKEIAALRKKFAAEIASSLRLAPASGK